jgi:hypothetical protein
MRRLLASIAAAVVFAAGFTVASEPAASSFAARHSNSVSKTSTISNTLRKGDRLDIGHGRECQPNQVVGQHTNCSSPADQRPSSPQRTVVVELIQREEL